MTTVIQSLGFPTRGGMMDIVKQNAADGLPVWGSAAKRRETVASTADWLGFSAGAVMVLGILATVGFGLAGAYSISQGSDVRGWGFVFYSMQAIIVSAILSLLVRASGFALLLLLDIAERSRKPPDVGR